MDNGNKDIVISGIGGYFPKCKNFEEFQKNLIANEDLLSTRWEEGKKDVNNRLGCAPNVDLFDTSFFAIHRHQAAYMDPMQRMILERTFEALIDAGVSPKEIRGRKIGVYIGSTIGENDSVFYESMASGFGVTGHSRAMISNRISYWLNLKGPSCAYDSNWLSGFDVIQNAYGAIKNGQIEAAIVGTANLALNSEISFLYHDIGLISPDGITRPFDADANGYARSDGFVVFYLQRACDARRIHASILNVGSRFYGDYEGRYLEKSVDCMAEYLEEFTKETKVNLDEIEYLETYGSGVKSIDEAELESIERVYCKKRSKPLQIGSVKPNTGHSEPSSGMFGICKAIVAMESGIIPATINHKNPNPNIKGLFNGSLKVLTTNTNYLGGLIAVNCIGLTNGIGHIILKPNPRIKPTIPRSLPNLIIASTRTESGMKEILEEVSQMPKVDEEFVALSQITFSTPINSHLYRGFKVLGENADGLEGSEYYTGNKREIWFVYSGMGSQWSKMGSDLMHLPIFKESIEKSHAILQPKGIDLINILTSEDPTIFDNILHSFVGIAAIQIALTDILRALNIVPDGIIGHSVGELGCAYGDGALTAEEMILCAYSRGRASLEAELIKGMMAAVGLGYEKIKTMVPPSIEVACHNGPDSSTISGPTEDMEKFVKELQDKGIFARLVNVANIAYHSKYIKPAGPLLLKYLREVIKTPRLRSNKWISTSAPENKWNLEEAKYSSAEYHTNNLLGSVLFEEGSRHIPKDSVVIEIAPHGLLQAILKRSLASGCTNIPLTSKQAKNSLNFLLSAVGKIYLAGIDVNPAPMFPKVELPVSRGTPALSSLVRWEHGETWKIGIEHKTNFMVSIKEEVMSLTLDEYRPFFGHQLNENVVMPLSYIPSMIFSIVEKNIQSTITNVILEDLRIENYLTIPKVGVASVYAIFQRGTGRFELTYEDKTICTGSLKIPGAGDEFMHEILEFKESDDFVQLSASDVYNEFAHRGQSYKAPFKSIKSLRIMEEGSIALLQNNTVSNKWQDLLEAMLQQVLFRNGEKHQKTVVPKAILRIAISTEQIKNQNQNQNNEEIESKYNYLTGIVSIPGIQITGVKTKPLPENKIAVSYNSLEFTPFENRAASNMENVINASFRMAVENFHEPSCTNCNVIEIETKNPQLLPIIKRTLEDCVDVIVNISSTDSSKLHGFVSHNDPALFVMNDSINESIINILTSTDAFVLARTDKNILNYNNIIEFASFELNNGDNFSLLRKASSNATTRTSPVLIHVKDDVLTCKEQNTNTKELNESKWMSELRNAVQQNEEIENKIYLISNIQPLEGISEFSKELRLIDEFKHVRCLFLLDKNAPAVSTTNNKLYENLFKKDPMVSILVKGKIGTNITIPTSIKLNARNNIYCPSQMVQQNQQKIQYIGINLKDETMGNPNVKNETGNLDYVLTTGQGEIYSGLAFLEQETSKFIADPILKWKIPVTYNEIDAAAIPHAFTTAFYSLVMKGELQEGSTILIHSGCTPIGIASIAIALMRRCTVFTTVETQTQKAYLKNTFPMIQEDFILSSKTIGFESKVMEVTNGSGVDIVLNNLSGALMQASGRCLGMHGRFLQLGKYDMEENNFIGMRMFLKYNTFIGIVPEEVFFLSNEEKQRLHDLVNTELYTPCFVTYMKTTVIKNNFNITDILSKMRDEKHIGKIIVKVTDDFQVNKLSHDKSNQFICDTKSSYFIYGGSAETWADMAEWLILRGARKVVVSSDSKPQQAYINRRLSLLQTYFQADIVYTPERATTKDAASELLSEVYYLGPIHAVFLLPGGGKSSNMQEIKALQHVENSLRTVAPKSLLINFVPLATGFLQQRIEAGFPTFNLQFTANAQQNFNNKNLQPLDEILQLNVKNVQIKYERVSEIEEETTQMLYRKLALMLPSQEDVEEALKNQEDSTIKLEQLHSLTARNIRTIPPLFILSGLSHFNNIKELAKKLHYPVFHAKLPITGSDFDLLKLAEILAQNVMEIYPKGPYNLLAMSSSGVLAIEVAKILSKSGKGNVLVFFIDSAPDSIQASLKLLGDGIHKEVNLLTRILAIDSFKVIESLRNAPNWESKLEIAVNNSRISYINNKELLKKLLTTYAKNIDQILAYKASSSAEELYDGKYILVRPTGSNKFDNCGLIKYCKETPIIEVIGGDHSSMVLHKELIELLNNRGLLK